MSVLLCTQSDKVFVFYMNGDKMQLVGYILHVKKNRAGIIRSQTRLELQRHDNETLFPEKKTISINFDGNFGCKNNYTRGIFHALTRQKTAHLPFNLRSHTKHRKTLIN